MKPESVQICPNYQINSYGGSMKKGILAAVAILVSVAAISFAQRRIDRDVQMTKKTAVGSGAALTRELNVKDTMKIEGRASAPSSPALGDIYVDSDSNELCFYDGSSWTGLKAAGTCA